MKLNRGRSGEAKGKLATPMRHQPNNLALGSVYQMSMLEVEDIGEGTPQGVVLALVGPDTNTCSRDQEATRTLRMYNLSSLISLAKWAVSQKVDRNSTFRECLRNLIYLGNEAT